VAYEWFYGPEHMDELLDRFHVGLVSSIWEEAYGYVGVELLAKGVPVLGNAIGGITDYCRDGETGWRNTVLTGAGLAERMAHIVRNRHEIPERNAWILEHRDELIKTLDHHVTEIEQIYAELTAATP
jgi:glycosyltransferase involved in cell wall biosynthesis